MAKSTPYSFHPVADEQQTDVWLYTYKHWGEHQADKYIDGLHKKILDAVNDAALLRDPPSGIDKSVKYIHYGRHYIFVRHPKGMKNHLHVLTILHETMDIPFRLSEMLQQM